LFIKNKGEIIMANLINLAIALVTAGIFSAVMWGFKREELRPWMIVVAFFVSYPWHFGDDIYSLWGGKNPQGSVYSLYSVYTDAERDAWAILGIGYLNGGRDAVQGTGIGYLNGGRDAAQLFGISYLNGGRDAVQIIGISYLNGGRDAVQIIGISYLDGGHNAVQPIGIGYLNGGRDAVQLFGIGYLNGGRDAVQLVGIGAQIADKGKAVLGFGIPLYQKGGTWAGVSWKRAWE
jgi:hypothetical protein